jgi:hypothetical protein
MNAAPAIAAVVVSYRSGEVLPRCLDALRGAAPRRGVRPIVVDNASGDRSADMAASRIGESNVVRLPVNAGFAAGVNAGIRHAEDAAWIAVVNPDAVPAAGSLDALVEVLEARPRAALVGPRVVDARGREEQSVGRFPTLARERAHTWMLDRLLGLEGRRAPFPAETAPVDWVSGCAWLVRAAAARAVGPLDEGYFMYWEDVDWCRRIRDAGWEVLATPDVTVAHDRGRGSADTGSIPADGGAALVRYFEKFEPAVAPGEVRDLLRRGFALRLAWRRGRALLGDRASREVAKRYALALERLGDP